MLKARTILGRPALHVMLGVIFAIIFTWPLLAIERPINTWMFLYAFWGLSVFWCGLLALGEEATEGTDWEHAQDKEEHHV